MKKLLEAIGIAAICLTILTARPALALTETEVWTIAERVLNLGDEQATEAYDLLKQRGIFQVSPDQGDPMRELAFRVLDQNDAGVTQAFNYLKGLGIFDQLTEPELSDADRMRLENVQDALRQSENQMDRINPLVDEYNASWIPGRLRIRKQIGATIERARSYLNRAQSHFSPLKGRTEPVIQAVSREVEKVRREFNSYINWWNREFAN